MPLTAVFLVLALSALVFRAKKRHGYGAFALECFLRSEYSLASFSWSQILHPTARVAVEWVGHRVGIAACCAEKPII